MREISLRISDITSPKSVCIFFTGFGFAIVFLLSIFGHASRFCQLFHSSALNYRRERSLENSDSRKVVPHVESKDAVNVGSITTKTEDKLSEAAALKPKPKVFCWVMTSLENSNYHQAIMQTWGRRFHRIFFMIGIPTNQTLLNKFAHFVPSSNDFKEPIPYPNYLGFQNAYLVLLPMKDYFYQLWKKTKLAFQFLHRNFRGQYDWIFKVDDNCFVIVENLVKFLSTVPKEGLYYYGYPFSAFNGYNSGGPGYALSSCVVDLLIKSLVELKCMGQNFGPEDIHMSECLRKVNVSVGRTHDDDNRARFSPFNPLHTLHTGSLLPQKYNWFWRWTAYNFSQGVDCCSEEFISFHYVTPEEMNVMEFMIYHLSPKKN